MGKQADFVILSDNPLTVDPLEIASIKVLQTINDSETVYQMHNDSAAMATVVGAIEMPRAASARPGISGAKNCSNAPGPGSCWRPRRARQPMRQ